MRNILIGRCSGNNITEAENCIIIGDYAGEDIIKEKNLFVFRIGPKEWQTKITDEEYETISNVINRLR